MLIRAIVQELIEAVIKAEGEGGDYVHMQWTLLRIHGYDLNGNKEKV
jgi:hypothetical protein